MRPKGLPQALSFRLLSGLKYFFAVSFALIASPSHADVFSELSDADQAAVARICLPVQYQDGAAAYRECVLAEVSVRGGQPGSATSALSFDEQYAIQQVCQPAADSAYQQCVSQQLEGLAQIPIIQLDLFDNDEVYALQQNCFTTQSQDGVKAYRQCINAAARDLQALPQPNLSALDLLDRNALQLRCSALHTAASDYRQCLLDSVGGVSDTIIASEISQPLASATPNETSNFDAPLVAESSSNSAEQATTPAISQSINEPLVTAEPVDTPNSTGLTSESAADAGITNPLAMTESSSSSPTESIEPDQPLTQTPLTHLDSSADPTLAAEPTGKKTGIESVTSIARELWTKVQSNVSGLSNMGRLISAVAIALPILLLGFWLLIRGREPEPEYYAPGERNPLLDRVGPSQQHRDRPNRDFETPRDKTDHLDLSQQADDMSGEFPANRPPLENLDVDESSLSESLSPAAARQNPNSEYSESTAIQNPQQPPAAAERSAEENLEQLSSTEQAGFLAWLNHQPADTRQPMSIEFLIYWLAYGDDRYEPAMKEAVFQIQDPDEHEQIKRWVLMQDIYAFSDVVYWLQHNTTLIQREQILDLLMALIINENALTPVQNTILRFLGDAFGLGHDRLDARFRTAFDQAMPPLPRVDKPRWWDRQQEDQRRRWDARTVSRQSREIQYRVKLGLPLTGEVRQKDVAASFRRAAARCHPQRFDHLGPREQSLAERQFEKFQLANDSLLEISV
jgi:hypothetical protein